MSTTHLINILIILLTLALLIGLLRWIQFRLSPHGELVRKLFHMGGGTVALSFPWLFDNPWPVIILTIATMSFMLAVRHGPLQQGVGAIVTAAGRQSYGEFFFPLGVGVLFIMSKGDPLLYSVPLFILTFSDSFAALVGRLYGKRPYAATDGEKTTEGSLAFFLITFFGTLLPLLIFTEIRLLESVSIALLLGFLLMIIEAVAWRGLDNIFIPVSSFLVLKTLVALAFPQLVLHLFVTIVCLVIILFWRVIILSWRLKATLNDSALMGALLVGYVTWVLGGWQWMIAPITLLIGYTLFMPRTEWDNLRIHNIHVILAVCLPGLIWLFLSNLSGNPMLIYPFSISFAAQLAMTGVARVVRAFPRWSVMSTVAFGTLKGELLIFLPFLLVQGFGRMNVTHSLLALPGIAITAIAFLAMQPNLEGYPYDAPRWIRQSAFGMFASLTGLLPLYILH